MHEKILRSTPETKIGQTNRQTENQTDGVNGKTARQSGVTLNTPVAFVGDIEIAFQTICKQNIKRQVHFTMRK